MQLSVVLMDTLCYVMLQTVYVSHITGDRPPWNMAQPPVGVLVLTPEEFTWADL